MVLHAQGLVPGVLPLRPAQAPRPPPRRRSPRSRRRCAASGPCSSTPSACSRAATSWCSTRGSAPSAARPSRPRTGAAAAASTTPVRRRRSSTGRTPPACCPWRSGPGSPSVAASSVGAGSAGTTCRPPRWTRCATSCAPRGRSRPPSSAVPRRAASGGTGRSRRSGVEWLLDIGDVVCVRRVGWRRVYDLAERAIPEARARPAPAGSTTTAFAGPDDDTCLARAAARSVRVCGVGTSTDVADVHRLGSVTEPRARGSSVSSPSSSRRARSGA